MSVAGQSFLSAIRLGEDRGHESAVESLEFTLAAKKQTLTRATTKYTSSLTVTSDPANHSPFGVVGESRHSPGHRLRNAQCVGSSGACGLAAGKC